MVAAVKEDEIQIYTNTQTQWGKIINKFFFLLILLNTRYLFSNKIVIKESI